MIGLPSWCLFNPHIFVFGHTWFQLVYFKNLKALWYIRKYAFVYNLWWIWSVLTIYIGLGNKKCYYKKCVAIYWKVRYYKPMCGDNLNLLKICTILISNNIWKICCRTKPILHTNLFSSQYLNPFSSYVQKVIL